MMQSIQLGWVDYSNEHRNKVMSVLNALATPEAVDELGIGVIRDGFADIFFPGTSTIQTRAKYFFIVPYILMEIERSNVRTPEKFISTLHEMEIELIDSLKETAGDEGGVIGARAGKGLKRKPSSIYWHGLRTYEFFQYPHLSLDGYVKEYCKLKQQKSIQKSHGAEIDGMSQDDSDAMDGQISSNFWKCLMPTEGWKETLSIELTKGEAKFLKEKILTAQATKDSLYAVMLRDESHTIYNAIDFASIDVNILPDALKGNYQLARDFSEFIFGAIIRYNVILSGGQNEKAEQRWQQWKNSDFVREKLASFSYNAVFEKLQIKNSKLKTFIAAWKEAVLSGNEQVMDELVTKREKDIKGKARAKLNNPTVFVYKEGIWLGGDTPLQYRFGDAKKMMKDIETALEVVEC